MNTAFRSTLALSLFLCLPAAQAAEFTDRARVLDARPRMREFNEPHEECRDTRRDERRDERGDNSTVGAVIGGVAGGIIGHQVGRGSGRDVATAAGAITGAIVGNEMGGRDSGRERGRAAARDCRQVDNWVSRPDGYDVRYEYEGHEYSAVLPYDPGRNLRLRVTLTPEQ
jgi:uncharacterized protein YcfJ